MKPHSRTFTRLPMVAAICATTAMLTGCPEPGPTSPFTWTDTLFPTVGVDTSQEIKEVRGEVNVHALEDGSTYTVGLVEYDRRAGIYNDIDMLITRYNDLGERQWEFGYEIWDSLPGTLEYYCDNNWAACGAGTFYRTFDSHYDWNAPKDSAVTADDGIVVVGTTANNNVEFNSNYWVATKYTAAGDMAWQKLWKSCATLIECKAQAFSVAVGPQTGNIYISGHGWNTGGTERWQLQVLDANGERLWHNTRGFSQTDSGYDTYARVEGGAEFIYATEPHSGYLQKFDAAGNHQWDHQTDSGRILDDNNGNIITVSRDGSLVAKFDTAGNRLWSIENGAADGLGDAVTDADGNVYVTARNDQDVLIYRVDNNGGSPIIAWSVTWNQPVAEVTIIGLDLSESHDVPRGIELIDGELRVTVATDESQSLIFDDNFLSSILTVNADTGEVASSKTTLAKVNLQKSDSDSAGNLVVTGQTVVTDISEIQDVRQYTGRYAAPTPAPAE